MREIKFRAWHPEFEMNYLENLGWFDGLDSGEWDVMQFIGVHDKNGTEIYEGDILKFNNSNDIYIVVWFKEHGCWALSSKINYDKYSLYKSYKSGRTYLIDSKSVSIIGNIYQNPELLEPC